MSRPPDSRDCAHALLPRSAAAPATTMIVTGHTDRKLTLTKAEPKPGTRLLRQSRRCVRFALAAGNVDARAKRTYPGEPGSAGASQRAAHRGPSPGLTGC